MNKLLYIGLICLLACDHIAPPALPEKKTDMIFIPRWHRHLALDDALVMQEIELAHIARHGEKRESLLLDYHSIQEDGKGNIERIYLTDYGSYIDRFDLNLLKGLRGLKILHLGNVTPKELDIIYTLKGLDDVVLCADRKQIDSAKAARMRLRYGFNVRRLDKAFFVEDYPYE